MEPRLVVFVGEVSPGREPEQPSGLILTSGDSVVVEAKVTKGTRLEARLVRLRRGGTQREIVATWKPEFVGDLVHFSGKLPEADSALQQYHLEIWREGDPKPWGFCSLSATSPSTPG